MKIKKKSLLQRNDKSFSPVSQNIFCLFQFKIKMINYIKIQIYFSKWNKILPDTFEIVSHDTAIDPMNILFPVYFSKPLYRTIRVSVLLETHGNVCWISGALISMYANIIKMVFHFTYIYLSMKTKISGIVPRIRSYLIIVRVD